MAERINPYIAGAPVTDPAMFFGREDVFAWIERNIAGQYADNTLVIHGQRRVGKTSVLKQLGHRLSSRYVPVFFDLQGRTHTTLDHFLWRLAREIARALRTRYGVELSKPELGPFSQDLEYFPGVFLAEVRQALGERNLVLVFDEFDSLEEPTAKEMLAGDLIPYFSRMLHGTEHLNFVFSIGSSGHKLEHMQADYTDFFRSALYKKISFLEPVQARQLIVEPVQGLMTYEPPAVARVLAVASGHPYFTQLTCHELFAQCERTGDWNIGVDDVEAVLPEVIERGTVNLKFVWDDATDPERYTLAALALLSGPVRKAEALAALRKYKVRISDEEVGAALLSLGSKDVLTDKNTFTVDLLRLWLLRNRPIERVVEELGEKHPIAVRYSQIAEEYREQGELDAALENYQRALSAAPDYIPVRLGIAEVHREAGRWEEVIAAYQAVLRLDAENVQAQTGLCDACITFGDTLQEAGDIVGAMACYRQVLDIYAEHTEAQERLADLDRVATVQRQLARSRERQELDDWYAEARYALSEGDHGKAAGLLHKVVDRDPEYRDAKQLLARAEAVAGKRKQRRGLRQLVTGLGVTGAIVGLVVVACLAVVVGWGLLNGWAPLIQTPTPTLTLTPTPTSTPTSTPTATPTPTPTDTPMPTDEPTPTSEATLAPTPTEPVPVLIEEPLGDGWTRYTQPAGGYSIELPETWVVYDMTDGEMVELMLRSADLDPVARSNIETMLESELIVFLLYGGSFSVAGDSPPVFVYVFKSDMFAGMDPNAYINQVRSIPDLVVVESSVIEINGIQAAYIVYDMEVSDGVGGVVRIRFVQVMIPTRETAFVITAATTVEDFGAYEDTFERIIDSFEVLE
ncbi:MAG: tetratricopeptide repeat protein [Anaerolineae bacterium]|nr:tetratricopeptide repeat protein [Anaerolineae bacterium]